MQGIKHIFEKYPLHPLFVGLFPVASLLAANVDKAPVYHAITPALVSISGALLLWGIFYLATRLYYTSALSASWFVVLFFSYGSVFKLTHEAFRHRYFLLAWCFLFFVGVFCLYRLKKFDKKITYIGNIMAAVLVMLSVGQIVAYKINTYIIEPPLPDHIATFDYGIVTAPAVLPDVYYIIIDAYASQWSFSEFYKLDISEFTSYLTNRGFYIVPKSTSNYSKTIYSLSSQLNMDYLDSLLGIEESVLLSQDDTRGNQEKLGRLIENNRLIRFMKDQGYHTIHVGSPWTYTIRNKYADENINLQPIPFESEFSLILYDTTVLETVTESMELLDHRKLQWKRVQHELDELGSIAARPEPTYVFAHLEIPHHPYVFDVDGSFVPVDVERGREEKDNYARQVQYLNTVLPKLIDRILEESTTPPIIVLQSDHGSASAPLHDYTVSTTKGFERNFILQEGMRNFSAVYLPEKDDRAILPENLTPVNVWRVILNKYFGTNLEILPNKNFFKVAKVPGFIDATDIVAY